MALEGRLHYSYAATEASLSPHPKLPHFYWASGQKVESDDLLEEWTFAWWLISEDHDFRQRKLSAKPDVSEEIDDWDDFSEVIG